MEDSIKEVDVNEIKKETQKISRTKILPAFIIVVVIAVGLMFLMNALQPSIIEWSTNNNVFFSFGDMMAGAQEGSFFYRVMWYIGDMTEGALVKTVPASIGMVIMALIACALERKKSRHAGTGVGGNGRIFPAILIGSLISAALCQLIYGSFFSAGWIPTFTPFLLVPAYLMSFGANVQKTITAIILGALIPFPISYVLIYYVVLPLQLPLFIGNAFGMMLAIIIGTEISRLLPWMMKKDVVPAPAAETIAAPTPVYGNKFFVRRVFADTNELVFWGSNLAGIGMYVGATVAWVLNPMHPIYGLGNFPIMLCAQVCSTALAILIWYPKYAKTGIAFTFPGIVLTSAIATTYANAWQIMIPTIIVGALVFAPLLEWMLKAVKYNGRWHVATYVLFSIGAVCTIWAVIVANLIAPFI